MMRLLSTLFIISRIIISSRSENLPELGNKYFHKNLKGDEDYEVFETRYHAKNNDRGYNEWKTPIKDSYLSEAFQAPRLEAHDYWDEEQKKSSSSNKRTFFESTHYFNQQKDTTAPSFYKMVTSFFDARVTNPAPKNFYNEHHHQPLYLSRPLGFKPPLANYLPPSKPIRASVIKLETITRSPIIFPPFHYDSTTQYFPHIESILNQVLIENSKKRHHYDLSFHYQGNPANKVIANPINTPVLPKPFQFPPTTLKPFLDYTKFQYFQNQTLSKYPDDLKFSKKYNKNNYNYPASVQDQLSSIQTSNHRIPYVAETTLLTFPTTLFPTSKKNNSTDEEIDTRSFDWVTANVVKKEWLRNWNNTSLESSRKSKDFTLQKYAKPGKNSVETITNLTVEGLKKIKNENANIHNYVNYFNTNNLINYEIGRLKNSISITDSIKESVKNRTLAISEGNISLHAVNLNDDLSLDAKILKDTHWDGIATETSVTALLADNEEIIKTKKANQAESKKNLDKFDKPGLALNADNKNDTTSFEPELFNSTEKDIDFTSTLATPITEFTTIGVTELGLFVTTTEKVENSSKTTLGHDSDRFEAYVTKKETAVLTEEVEATTATQKKAIISSRRRKYNRRAKIVNFTPYPTVNELTKKTINRNNFPKRQKPNITLSFGNKNIIKARDGHLRDEVMKFSDEDVTKRKRKVGKRRQVVKRTRILTSESPLQE